MQLIVTNINRLIGTREVHAEGEIVKVEMLPKGKYDVTFNLMISSGEYITSTCTLKHDEDLSFATAEKKLIEKLKAGLKL